jgi:hypothetical protein
LFSTRAARLGTLHELTKLAPVAIIAETLGYSPTTIERHATDSATACAQYIAAAKNSRPERRGEKVGFLSPSSRKSVSSDPLCP